MKYLVEYYPGDKFFVHKFSNITFIYPESTIEEERSYYYKEIKFAYNCKTNNSIEDGDLFSYNNSWWLAIEAKSIRHATIIFWKKMREEHAKKILKRIQENSVYGLGGIGDE